MGFLLREVLKSLCGGEIGWSYAVFWKIGCQNPALLIWEEGHYEMSSCSGLSGISGLESTELIIKEWEALWKRPEDGRGRANDRVGVLVNKMMMQQVHVVGRGVVGRAAFTGDHQWILQETHMNNGYLSGSLSESLVEVQNQFLAGIQTIAVIPVLPHGVVQLGSTQLIIENMEFVNHVKSLFMQLGNVPGALLSDNTIKALDQNVQVPTLVVTTVSTARPIHAYAKMAARPAPFNGENYNPQILKSPLSTYFSQPSCSVITQIHGTSTNVSAAPPTCNTTTMAEPLGDLFQRKISPIVKPNLALGSMGNEVMFSSPSAQLNQQISNSSSEITLEPSVVRSGVTFHSLSAIESQILSGFGLQEAPKNNLPASKNAKTDHLLSNGCKIPSSVKDSVIVSLLGRSGLPNTGNELQILSSIPHASCTLANHNSSYTLMQGSELDSAVPSHMSTLPRSDLHAHSGALHPGHPSDTDEHDQAMWMALDQEIEKDLFQALSIPLADSFEHAPRFRVHPGFLQDHEASSSRSHNVICKENDAFTAHYVETAEGSIAYEPVRGINENPSDALVQPRTGDDLFSALGLDCNNLKQVHRRWDADIFSNGNGLNENTENLNTDMSTCITEQDVAPFFSTMNDGISESGIFSETGTDHLLDAVVSKIHSVSKPNLDDTVSCKSTLSKICSSTLRSNSTTHDRVDISERMQGELFGLSAALVKAEIAGSCPLKSACTVDNTDGKYKSQISLWVENGQNMKNDSIATANSKMVDETGKPNRKRSRPGESSRPRPKDRQMIQDRVKELREIVPNGAKCSIDSLLERTIKHMLFLQSVTKHADKLKQTGESKSISKEGGLLVKDNFEGGATWAFEVGSQSMVCPIIVEDLVPPRQMLVEMVCEERGFFLEIADIIRGLGLTILKGVMEAHDDKIWARFAVEANRDVTRTEIFLSLVPLLEQTGKSSSTANDIDNGNMVSHIFHQSSIPAAGLVNSLQ